MKKAVTLLSGGLDSAVATLLAKKEAAIALALTFDYGQRAASREIAAARAFCRRHKIEHETVELPWLARISGSALTDRKKRLPSSMSRKSAAAVWVPNRNAVLANIAAGYAEALGHDLIIAGFNTEEAATFPDNSKEFVRRTNKLFAKSTRSRPILVSPLQKMKKSDIARIAVSLKIHPHFFWSCYEGGARMCARCESCMRTIAAFKSIGAWDLIKRRFR